MGLLRIRRDRGTEGSTKRIIIGTSLGELYEYSLHSPLSSGKGKPSAFDARAGEISAMDDGDSDPIDAPVLLHRLNGSASRGAGKDGGAVCGLLFHRVVGGVPSSSAGAGSGGCAVVLASTGGAHRRTRLHAFRGEPSASSPPTLRSAFLPGPGAAAGEGGAAASYVEIPGSVDFAELCSYNGESFALRTETGIYYGATERIMMTTPVASSMGSAVGSGGLVDTGLLAYDSLETSAGHRGAASGSVTAPESIGLTPHHFVTLSSSNDVKFINRVAKRVIQEERVDWVSVSQASSMDGSLQFGGLSCAELLTDIRRPDQIWLRKGRSLVHISSSCENRDVWKYTLGQCIETASAPHRGLAPSRPGTAGSGAADGGNALMTSEEKHIESQFEHAKSLCSNAVRERTTDFVLSASRTIISPSYQRHWLRSNEPVSKGSRECCPC